MTVRAYEVRVEHHTDNGLVAVDVTNPEGAPFAGHSDSTGSIPLEDLLRWIARDIARDFWADR